MNALNILFQCLFSSKIDDVEFLFLFERRSYEDTTEFALKALFDIYVKSFFSIFDEDANSF